MPYIIMIYHHGVKLRWRKRNTPRPRILAQPCAPENMRKQQNNHDPHGLLFQTPGHQIKPSKLPAFVT
jgi:hypothetical protein